MSVDVPASRRPAAGASPATAVAQARPLWRQVAVPAEHGGWSLTAEPALLGLLVAWSVSGLLLAFGAMVAFVARTPLKTVLVDRRRGRRLARTRLASLVLAAELVALGALALGAFVATDDRRFWAPLACAAPLVIVELWFDMRSKGRRVIPELAGTIGIGSVAAAIALADRRSTAVAIGLWLVIAARGGAAVPYVRTQIFRLHGRAPRRAVADLAQVVAVVAVAVGLAAGAVEPAAFVIVAVVAACNLVLVRRPPRPAKVIGMQQMAFGVAVVAVTAAAVLAA